MINSSHLIIITNELNDYPDNINDFTGPLLPTKTAIRMVHIYHYLLLIIT